MNKDTFTTAVEPEPANPLPGARGCGWDEFIADQISALLFLQQAKVRFHRDAGCWLVWCHDRWLVDSSALWLDAALRSLLAVLDIEELDTYAENPEPDDARLWSLRDHFADADRYHERKAWVDAKLQRRVGALSDVHPDLIPVLARAPALALEGLRDVLLGDGILPPDGRPLRTLQFAA